MNIKDLNNFLIEAKKATYADSTSNSKVESTRKGSKDYEYKNDNFIYHDTYFGGINFIGEEVVYDNLDNPIWAMNYYGRTLDETLSEEAMDNVLRPALMMVGKDETILPIRGPRIYKNNGYEYVLEVEGTLENFHGEESIYKDGKKIYTLKCHGGFIK